MFCFVGLQAIFGSFFVSYLSAGMGYSLTAAGSVFALALLHLTGAYGWGFALGAFPAAVVGWRLVRGARQTR